MHFANFIKDFFWISNSKYPILQGSLHPKLVNELDTFVKVCNEIYTNDLGFLKNHSNAGENTFQVSVPSTVLRDSYMFAFLNHLGEYFVEKAYNFPKEKTLRNIILRENTGHFDSYDFWLNIIKSGDVNPLHKHSGMLSGVIYYSNENNIPTYFDDNTEINGKKGDIILFPADAWHGVKENNNKNTRLTFAFNMEQKNDY